MLPIISILFVIPFLLWLSIFLTKFKQQKKTSADFKVMLKNMPTENKIAILAILLFVISSYVLSSMGFYYSFLKPTGAAVLVGLLVLTLCIFAVSMKLGHTLIV